MHELQADLLSKNTEKDEFHDSNDFFLKRKKNSRIPDIHKIRLVRDSFKNSLSINQVREKYYIGYTSARSIINEVMNAQEYAQAMEKRMGRQRLNQTE